MTLASLMVHDVVVVRPATVVDVYGNEAKDWASATRSMKKGWLARQTASELRGQREAQVSGWVLYLHAGADIDSSCRVEHDGSTFEVDGPVLTARTPRGAHHVEVTLRVVEG